MPPTDPIPTPAGGDDPTPTDVLAAIEVFRQNIDTRVGSIDTEVKKIIQTLADGRTTAEEVQAFEKRIDDLKTELTDALDAQEKAIAEMQANAKRSGQGAGGDEEDVIGSPWDLLMDAGLGDALAKWNKFGRSNDFKFSVDFEKYYDRKEIGPKDSAQRLSWTSLRNRHRQSLTTGRFDETGGSFAHFQPEFVQPGLVREPDPPTSVLRVLGVINQAQAVFKFNRRTKRIVLVGNATSQTALAGGPHTFTFEGVEGWLGVVTTSPVIVRHTNGTEETGFTVTTIAAISGDDAESKLNIGTIGITGNLVANLEIGDIFYLADADDVTLPARRHTAGVLEGEKSPIGKLITELVTLNAVKFAIAWKIPEERLEDEPELEREMRTDFDEAIQWTLARNVWQGTGTAGTANERQMTGILQDGGRQTQNQLVGQQEFDTIARAINKLTREGHVPAALFLHPDLILKLRLEKDADGRYLMSITDDVGRVWNVPVFNEIYMNDSDTDIGCLIAQNAVQIRSVGQTVFAMTNSDGEDFTAGIITMKLVPRMLLSVQRPLGIVEINFSP